MFGRKAVRLVGFVVAMVPGLAALGVVAASPTDDVETAGAVVEVLLEGSEMEGPFGREGLYRSGRMYTEASQPQGYPRPTSEGAVEIKRYPTVRRAVVEGTGSVQAGSRMGFMPLFNHIKANDVAMTAPVEMEWGVAGETIELTAGSAGEVEGSDAWRMAFLYERLDQGETGIDDLGVRVVDEQPVTVLSIGVRGTLTSERIAEAELTLDVWASLIADEWVLTGEKRRMSYNSPAQRRDQTWHEVQYFLEPAVGASQSD